MAKIESNAIKCRFKNYELLKKNKLDKDNIYFDLVRKTAHGADEYVDGY
ncbi:MAG: hypothetical protein PHR26_00850 [Candidatus ainarchaeum sp.]|nr:hypothetical protein [Candidatus ainarchaeum sp.]MDD3976127.1 hypothetical protein [Candidatus ainarchaeum sp.]